MMFSRPACEPRPNAPVATGRLGHGSQTIRLNGGGGRRYNGNVSTMPANPLYEEHRQAEAELQGYVEMGIVSTFGEPQEDNAGLHKGCGMLDRPQRGLLEMSGEGLEA